MAADGLDLLRQTRRERTVRRPRVVPPPKHPKAPVPERSAGTAETEPPPPVLPAPTGVDIGTTEAPQAPQLPPTAAPTHTDINEPSAVAPPPSSGALEKRSFHVDAYVNDYLRDVEREVFERNDRKLDVSSSAVVRLAFRVLAEQMTAAQVVDRLAATPTSDGPGRKRR
jgi:hypothetical protein